MLDATLLAGIELAGRELAGCELIGCELGAWLDCAGRDELDATELVPPPGVALKLLELLLPLAVVYFTQNQYGVPLLRPVAVKLRALALSDAIRTRPVGSESVSW